MPMPQNDFENGIKVEFWIDDHIHAIRYSIVVPTIGDEVRFNDVAYKIHYRIFIYDEPSPRVAVNMEAVEHQMQPTDGTSRQKASSKRKAKTAKSVGSPTSG